MKHKILPYVYRLDNPQTGEFYIGGRFRNKHFSSEDLGVRYFTSSKKIKPIFNSFISTIIAEFFDEQSAYEFEQLLIKEHWHLPGCLNGNYRVGDKTIYLPTEKTFEHRQKISKSTLKNYQLRPELRISAGNGSRGKPGSNTGKTYSHTPEAKQKITESLKNKNGINARRFCGYWITPWGTFESSNIAATEITKLCGKSVTAVTIQQLCIKFNSNSLQINKPYHKNFTKGLTPAQLGWSFQPKH